MAAECPEAGAGEYVKEKRAGGEPALGLVTWVVARVSDAKPTAARSSAVRSRSSAGRPRAGRGGCGSGTAAPARTWRGCQGRTSSRGTLSSGRFHRERAHGNEPGRRPLLQPAEDAEQWIKEGKTAIHWTRLSCHRFRANEVRLLLGVIAYNLGNLLRRVVLPGAIQSWSLTSPQQRLFKAGG